MWIGQGFPAPRLSGFRLLNADKQQAGLVKQRDKRSTVLSLGCLTEPADRCLFVVASVLDHELIARFRHRGKEVIMPFSECIFQHSHHASSNGHYHIPLWHWTHARGDQRAEGLPYRILLILTATHVSIRMPASHAQSSGDAYLYSTHLMRTPILRNKPVRLPWPGYRRFSERAACRCLSSA